MTVGSVEVRRLLVVDGETATADMLRAMPHGRAEAPLAIESAPTAGDALLAMAERRHDAYLVNVEMDRASGGELLRAAVTAGGGAAGALLDRQHHSPTGQAGVKPRPTPGRSEARGPQRG